MTLEEFLSLPDVKDGITTSNRIEELLALMQKEKDGEVKSVSEATRQHSAIARAIIETKDANCLDHFIKLGGLWYINGWLNDAFMSGDGTDGIDGDFLERSVTLHFKALEKLGISNEMLISSGISNTVKKLCVHNSTVIKEKASELLDSWKDKDLTLVSKNVEKVDPAGVNEEDEATSKSDEDVSLQKMVDVGPKAVQERVSDCLQLLEAEQVKAEATCGQISAPVSLDQINLDGEATGLIISTDVVSICIPEVVTPREGIINTDNSNSLQLRDNIDRGIPVPHETTNNGQVIEKINSTSADMEITEVTRSSNPQESEGCSSIPDILMAEQTMPEPGTHTNIDCDESLVPMRDNSVDDEKNVPSDNSSGMNDLAHQRSLVRGSPERTSPTQDTLPVNAASDIIVGLNNRSDEDYSKVSAIQNLARDTKSSAVAGTRSDIGFDCGIMDALEVARQVAKDLEMDMVNEGSYENTSDASRQPSSPDSTNETDSQSRNLSEDSSLKVDSSPQLSTENIHNEPEEYMQANERPQSQEVHANNNKETCEFDLNQDFPIENVEFSVNFDQNMGEENKTLAIQSSSSMPAHFASGSKLHVDAPQLDKSQGCSGSVGTSDFHQLSSHRDENPYGLPGTSGKQKQDAFSIDLNLDKEGNVSNDAAAPAKFKEFDFDLNMVSDVDDALPSSSWRLDKQNVSHFNGHPSSSSLFPMQHSKNIDLNEGTAMHSISSRPQPFSVSMSSSSQNIDVHPFFGVRQDTKPVISIMGARVEVDRNDYFHGAPSISNGKNENSMESNIGAMGSYLGIGPTGSSYVHPSHFAYNNSNAGPSMSFVSPVFRPGNTMTYMVDPRIGPLPQMVNSPSVFPHMYAAAQSPFFVSSTAGRPLGGFNGVLPSSPNIDLNLGFTNNGGNNRHDIAPRQQLFGNNTNNQGRYIGEHLIIPPPDAQPSSSFGKRKESETSWETYPYDNNHRYPPGKR